MVEVNDFGKFYRDLSCPGLKVAQIKVNDLPTATTSRRVDPPTPVQSTWYGSKYDGGLGPVQEFEKDYWTLRAWSWQLFTENLYAKGLVRRLITNSVNTGVSLEATPNEQLLGVPEDSLLDWASDVENLFQVWAENPLLCDYRQRDTFWELQRTVKLHALVGGDVLIVLHIDPVTGLPWLQLVNSDSVDTPAQIPDLRRGHKIEHGVELDPRGRQVAYWVEAESDAATVEYKRVPAYGPRSGRRVAWLVYGTNKRHDDVRGEPLLSVMLQHAKELDRNRDAVLRKALVNNIIAGFVTKSEETVSTRPFASTGISSSKATTTESVSGRQREFTVVNNIPGVFIDELAPGENINIHSNQANDVNFGEFEKAILHAIAWANEIPPTIYQLAFSSNYSASQGESNEFGQYLNMDRARDAGQFYKRVYQEWFVSSVLTGKVSADGFLDAWRDPMSYDLYGAWISSDWSGVVRPLVDPVKQATAYQIMRDNCWATNAYISKKLTNSRFEDNAKKVTRENEMLAKARAALGTSEPETQTEVSTDNEDESASVVVSIRGDK